MGREHPEAEIGGTIFFTFVQRDSTDDYIEFKFDTPQANPTTGWTIEPIESQAVPCIVSTCIMNDLMCVYQ